MLTGVLLHIVEPAGPVDFSFDYCAGRKRWRRTQDMGDAAFLVYHIHYADAIEGATVKRLTAGGRIKCGLIEVHPNAVDVCHRGCKIAEI